MDAFNSWQLVKELKQVTGLPAAASFGDWAAISDIVDESTAKVLRRSVSDGVIAPGYTPEALEILKKKKKGHYCIIEMDWDYEPAEIETREIYGMTFEQKRNDVLAHDDMLKDIVTTDKTHLLDNAKLDLLLSMVTLKYAQSNSVCFALNGQLIGVGAGQQSRIHCTRLAASKADVWYLRQHPAVNNLSFKEGVKRPEMDNLIDQFLSNDITEMEMKEWHKVLDFIPKRLTKEEKSQWLSNLKGVSMGSDAFIPFRDNIDRAAQSGVQYIVQPGGSRQDEIVINACDEYDITMAFTNLRLFHH